MNNNNYLDALIRNAIAEDIGDGDHTSLACIPAHKKGKAELLVKQEGILAGVEIVKYVVQKIDPNLQIKGFIQDGSKIVPGDVAFIIEGSVISLLQAERLILNILQRMSGIATQTHEYVEKLSGLKTKVLDTRKTTPGMRILEKEAVRIGGGFNHRMGLFDMILIKDNHIDFAGGIEQAIQNTKDYLKRNKRNLKIEVETRTLEDVKNVLKVGGVDRIMLDNYSIDDTRKAVELIAGKFETESSGGITLENLRDYAECGVDFISVGALTHQVKSLDMSLKAVDF
jgi:nicotinate-nucleotide pyrophosphorylase (carboxylating)